MRSYLLILLTLFFILPSCSGGGGGGTASSTNVTINLGQRELSGSSISLQAIPDSVKSIVIKVTGPGMSPIKRTINVDSGDEVSEEFSILNGDNRLFEVMAYDEEDGNTFVLFKDSGGPGMVKDLNGTPVTVEAIMQATDYDDDLTQGLDAIANGNIIAATGHFGTAEELSQGSNSNHADTARFFFAMTRIAGLFLDVVSDGNPNNGLTKLSDVLDAFDCMAADNFLNKVEVSGDLIGDDDGHCEAGEECTFITDILCGVEDNGAPGGNNDSVCEVDEECIWVMPADSPTGGELQFFIYDVFIRELRGAVANFNDISDTFIVGWQGPFSETTIESDYGDVLALRAAAKGMLSWLHTLIAFDLDIDIDDVMSADKKLDEVLDEYPTLYSPSDGPLLPEAKEFLTGSALDDIVDAIDWILDEANNGDPTQEDDFISIDVGLEPGQITQQDIDDAKSDIAKVRTCLDGSCTVDDNETPGDTADDTVINLSAFYDGFDMRAMLPPFVDSNATGTLPDSSFDGILVRDLGDGPAVLDEDLNNNGTADIFEDDIYYVYGGNTVPFDPYSWEFREDPVAAGYVFLGVANSSDGVGSFDGAYEYYLIQNFRNRGFWDEDYDVKVNTIEFFSNNEHQDFCCDQSVWSSSPLEADFMDVPDGNAFFMRNWDFILIQKLESATSDNIMVHTLP